MSPVEVVGVGTALALAGLVGIALVRSSYSSVIVLDPGRAWARKVCELADAHRGYRSTVISVQVEQLGEDDWELVLPDDHGEIGVARCSDLRQVEDLLTDWWHSLAGRRSLFRLATRPVRS